MRLAGAVRVLVCSIATVVAAVALTACANRSAAVNKQPHTGTGVARLVNGVQQVTVTTGPDLRFHPSTLVFHRGPARIVLRNATASGGGPPHNVTFSAIPGADVPTISAGEIGVSKTFMTPAPGRYSFVCTIHRLQGQFGVLIVRPGAAPS